MKNYLTKAKAKLKNSKGFTMIELIIVIAIIVILAAIAVPTFASFITSANETAAISDARNIYLATKVEVIQQEIGSGDASATTDATLLTFAMKEANVEDTANSSVTECTSLYTTDTSDKDITTDSIYFTYVSDNGIIVYCDNGEFTVG